MAVDVPLAALLLVGLALIVPTAEAASPPACAPQQSTGCMPACPEGLTGIVQRDGNVFLSWRLLSSTDINVYRSTDGGGFELVERLSFPTTRYVDHDVAPSHAYTYQVTAIGDYESPPCSQVMLTTGTSVPFFGGPVASVLAAGLGTVGYLVARRRPRN